MPLALQDYGERPFEVTRDSGIGFVGANFCLRKKVFADVGLFAPELQRVADGIGSMEDHELLTRICRSNHRVLYLPGLIVYALVARERMTREYHRRWHRGHGRFYAVMRSSEMEQSKIGKLLGVPAHLYRQCGADAGRWLGGLLSGRRDRAFINETRLCFFAGYFLRRLNDYLAR
jgi:hypothetical protein